MSLVFGLSFAALVLPLRAENAIFNNSVNDLVTRFDPKDHEVGDQIILGGTERYLTRFDFEYWGVNTADPNSFAGAVEARVRFYENNGAPFNGYSTPDSLPFYDSLWFAVPTPTERNTFVFTEGVDFAAGGLLLTSDEFTWTVQFRGMGETDSVGVDIYSPPAVGSDYPDYWENNGGWVLMTNSVPMDFAARMYANSTIPEPSSLVLSLFGGAGILVFVRRLRRAD